MNENVGIMLAQVSRLMRRSFDARARDLGVTRAQWQVLTILKRNEGIIQGRLADILEVEPITAGRMIDRMQDGKLVERRPDPADRRAWRLFLTPTGSRQLEQLRPFAIDTLEIALDGIAGEEREAFMGTLDRIRANLTGKVGAIVDG